MKKLVTSFVFPTLCLYMTTMSASSQEDIEYIGHYSAKLGHIGGNASGQSFYFPGGDIEYMRLAIFSRYAVDDHPATLSILEGNGPSGSSVFTTPVLVKTAETFFPGINLSLLSIDSINGLWLEIQNTVHAGVYLFDDLVTEFEIDQYVLPGQYTIMVTLDTSFSNEGYIWMISYANCGFFPCTQPYDIDPYPEGSLYWGDSLVASDISDMAFEIAYKPDVTTGLYNETGEEDSEEFLVPIEGNILYVPPDWEGGFLRVSDMLGRRHISCITKGRENVILPRGQIVCISLQKAGKIKVAKAFIR